MRLVESWESPDSFNSTRGNATRAIHAYTSAPSVELFVNGASQGARAVTRMRDAPGSYAEWTAVPWAAGNLTAVATAADGAVVATDARFTNGAPAALALRVDAPSALTGTGGALLLDGQDAALLRASVLDGAGRVMHLDSSTNVSFRVLAGPGVVQGTHNGDARAHARNDAPWRTAYHGLVRAVVRVTSVAARDRAERALLALIDAHGPMAAGSGPAADDVSDIVVEASAPGFAPVNVTIPVSTDAATAGVMAVAAATAGKPVDFFS